MPFSPLRNHQYSGLDLHLYKYLWGMGDLNKFISENAHTHEFRDILYIFINISLLLINRNE